MYLLQSTGASGMTILEELIDMAFKCCENGRKSGLNQHARGATLLECNGRVYSGCDISIKDNDPNAVMAEKAAAIAAFSAGASKFEVWFIFQLYQSIYYLFIYYCQCLVIVSDTMKKFPTPNGQSREFLRGIGEFPVILVNCNLETK